MWISFILISFSYAIFIFYYNLHSFVFFFFFFFFFFFHFLFFFVFFVFFFFFQAEDGIRDLTVTGVQTCALPIFDGRVIAAGHLDVLIAEHACCVVELTFDGTPPTVNLGDLPATVDGAVLRIHTPDPARAVPVIMSRLGAFAGGLRGVEVLRPSLDSVFLTLTGRRYASDGTDVGAA